MIKEQRLILFSFLAALKGVTKWGVTKSYRGKIYYMIYHHI